MKGNPIEMHDEIIEAIEAQIEVRKNGPADAPKSLKSIYKALGKNDFGKALSAANSIVEGGGDDAESATPLLRTIEGRIQSSLSRVDALLAEGMVLEAETLAGSLTKSLKGVDAFVEPLAAVNTAVDGADKKGAKALSKILKGLESSGPSDATMKKLASFASKAADGPVAARAKKLHELLAGA